jgi:ADP-ribosylglycohydrolase
MLGAIAGDIIGSVFEYRPWKSTDFTLFTHQSFFTDDTVLTVAVADCILHKKTYAETFQEYGHKYPYAGYGRKFVNWLESYDFSPYGSYGNGSAMRVSPVGFAFNTMEDVLVEAKLSAEVTHNHTEGIKGAQAIAAAIFLARQEESKEKIRDYVESTFGYDLHQKLSVIRPDYRFNETCSGSVPQSIISFLESEDFESAIRNAVSLGGDADTMAYMAGGIAQAYYKTIPYEIVREVRNILDADLLNIIDEFIVRFSL